MENEICKKREEYEKKISPMEIAVNPCKKCEVYDICKAKNKENRYIKLESEVNENEQRN